MPLCTGLNGQPCPVDKQAKHGTLCRYCNAQIRPAALRPAVEIVCTPAPIRTRSLGTPRPDEHMGSPLLEQRAQTGPLDGVDSDSDSVENADDEMEEDEGLDSNMPPNVSRDADATVTAAPAAPIVNEVLFYIANMLDIMEQSMLLKVCEDFFKPSVIIEAKQEVFRFNKNLHLRFTKRIGDRKNESNVRDIVDVFRKNNPKDFPIFVAADLGKIPPLDFSGANIAVLMCEVSNLRKEMDSLKSIEANSRNLVSEMEALKQQLRERDHDWKSVLMASKGSVSLGVQVDLSGVRRVDTPEKSDTAPVNSSTVDQAGLSEQCNVEFDNIVTPEEQPATDSDAVKLVSPPTVERLVVDLPKARNPTKSRVEPARKTWAERTASKPSENSSGDGFTTVGKDGRPLRPVTKPSVSSDDFLKPQRPSKTEIIYLSKVSTDVDCDSLQREIRNRCNVNVRCRKLNAKVAEPDYASFQIFATVSDAPKVLDKSKWPEWVVIRAWVRRRKSKEANSVQQAPPPEVRKETPKRTQTVMGLGSRIKEVLSDLSGLRKEPGTPHDWFEGHP